MEGLDCADEGNHVDIVPAGMHEPDTLPALTLCRCRRCIVISGLFDDRQTIGIGPHGDHRTIAVVQDGDETGLADPDGFETDLYQTLLDPLSGSIFRKRQLRIAVELLIELPARLFRGVELADDLVNTAWLIHILSLGPGADHSQSGTSVHLTRLLHVKLVVFLSLLIEEHHVSRMQVQ